MKLTRERLAGITLGRQFPTIRGRGRAAVRELFDRVGPIQSQVPRAPFLTAAARLPGVSYATVRDGFVDGDLIKTTNLRGTVHTSRPAPFGALDAVSRQARAVDLRRVLGLTDAGLTVPDLITEIEAFCTGNWRPRAELTEQIFGWLADRGASVRPGASSSQAGNLIWGHSGLLRRPRDDHWERRIDTLHRTAIDVVGPELAPRSAEQAMIELVRVHLSAYGPATRRDIAWWAGSALTPVDRALASMTDELVRHPVSNGEDLIDLAELPQRRGSDPGLRLLPEFDGLLLGYAPANRDRFIDREHLDRIWTRANGMFLPMILLDGRIVGGWRTMPGRPSADTVIELRPFTAGSGLTAERASEQITAAATALDLTVTDVRILPPG
ncbi:winged helix DNA-binding domain-containing protein [Microlunatus soli]|uniref:Winged helix DNA-binding domain-containing protein n=1 Tax=Microlunatus soli TaxID=630515 RepID=A0A1H1YJU9_9ACTN|nr:winged helix DNA-binding domain-containing protein [Microlunatus soli]SDT21727.1 Winged helix DNA-binding domain-containing protein [Microlunatus soli]